MAGANFTGLDKAFIPDEAIDQFAVVFLKTNGHVELADADTESIIGVAQYAVDADDVATGKAVVTVRMQGTSYVRIGLTEAVAIGALLCPDGANPGRVKVATTGDTVIGKSVGNVGATAGDRIVMQLIEGQQAVQ